MFERTVVHPGRKETPHFFCRLYLRSDKDWKAQALNRQFREPEIVRVRSVDRARGLYSQFSTNRNQHGLAVRPDEYGVSGTEQSDLARKLRTRADQRCRNTILFADGIR